VFAQSLGFESVWTLDDLPTTSFDAVIDASTDVVSPALALDIVEPGGRVVYIGLAGRPSPIDTRRLVLADATAVGILSGSTGLQGAIDLFASGRVDPSPLVAAVVGLDDVASVLAGSRDPSWSGPKIQVSPSSRSTPA
jgi:threonine dehydrogenase-like Zn-dependent dehydrogenase